MKKFGYDYYKVYDLKKLLKSIKSETMPEISKMIRILKAKNFTVDKLQNFSNDEIISALLVFALISK